MVGESCSRGRLLSHQVLSIRSYLDTETHDANSIHAAEGEPPNQLSLPFGGFQVATAVRVDK